jgi:hypothetical protein
MSIHLVLIIDRMCHRYRGAKFLESGQLEPGSPIDEVEAAIEAFRDQGITDAPPSAAKAAGELAFDRIVRESLKAGLLTLDEFQLRALWDLYDGTNEPDGYDGRDIHAELNRRGMGSYCAV